MSIFMIAISILTGASFIIIRTLNMKLSFEIGIYGSNLINHIAGALASSIIVFLAMQGMVIEKVNLLNAPFYAYLGGFMGALFIVLSNFTFSKTSVIASTILILSGQFLSSILVDILILQKDIGLKNIVGAIIIVLSVILYNSDTESEKDDLAIKAQLCHRYRTRFLHNGESFPLTARSCWNCQSSVMGKCFK
ncbi:DMT family transporter [Lutispora saccharofermentans]|uniref:DMT family transporter n=1 Tax=Lutispora saccharofermentans TaxID=3024236 RepID=A0ABT1NFL8_9FIRM|nr:DMT family transporter [Lutispora saccharofermentans]MCQ1530045.1 DMT family transporter [Lutispora saccharofermentans]